MLFSLHALLIFCFHFSHLTSFSLTTLCNFSLSTATCNRLHAFAGSVRIGCLISACNVHVILVRKHDILSSLSDTVVVSVCSIVVNIFLLVLLCFLASILF